MKLDKEGKEDNAGRETEMMTEKVGMVDAEMTGNPMETEGEMTARVIRSTIGPKMMNQAGLKSKSKKKILTQILQTKRHATSAGNKSRS